MSSNEPAKSEPVTVRILDREYTVGVSEAERASLTSAARMLDLRMREIRGGNKLVAPDRLAVLTALNLAHELQLLGEGGGVLDVVLHERDDLGLLQVGVQSFQRHQDSRHLDLIGDQGRHVGRTAHQARDLRLDPDFLEEAPVECNVERQGRADREHADLHLVLCMCGRGRDDGCDTGQQR